MRTRTSRSPFGARRGTMVPMLALGMVGLLAVTALAIDLGIVSMARTQAQVAADTAALAGARALNGERGGDAGSGSPITMADNNYAAAAPTARAAASTNQILGETINPDDVNVVVGKYYYDSAQSRFVSYPSEPGSINDSRYNWSLVRATVATQGDVSFASAFGHSPYNVSARATAVHRPRDIAIVLDFSGSMRLGSLLGIPISTNVNHSSNNPDPNYPRFGHYSTLPDSTMRQTQSHQMIDGNTYQASNFTAPHALNNFRNPLVEDFYQLDGGAMTPAFTSAGAGDGQGFVAGDRPLNGNFNASSTHARNVNVLLNRSATATTTRHPPTIGASGFETNGYDLPSLNTGQPFRGYTQGPGYWGKTFFIWPPDPRGPTNTTTAAQHDNGAKDWRKRFFLATNGTTPVGDNTMLWDSTTRDWYSPRTAGTDRYRINYRAILKWIQEAPNPFPPQLRAGRICYYDAFPNHADVTLNTRFWNFNPANPSGLNLNERFWKDYIDYVLGTSQQNSNTWFRLPNNTSHRSIASVIGFGNDIDWTQASHSLIYATPGGNPAPYMDYRDNPKRPITRMWFGPMSMVDFLGCYGLSGSDSYLRYSWMPGTAHEAPMYACKIGIVAALSDIESNHPNDMVSLIFYSMPKSSANQPGYRFNNARVPLSRDYQRMKDSLFYPPSTLDGYNPNNAPRPYDSDNDEVPRPAGGTCYAMGLMLAYNQFSGSPTLRTYNPSPAPFGDAGGLGRRGAHKLVILETDGEPTHTATASLTVASGPNSANHSYYRVRYNTTNPGSSEFPSVTQYTPNASQVTSQIDALVTRLCALETDPNPGFSTPRKPVQVHTVAFGPLFDNASAARTAGLQTLQRIERIGNTQTYSTPNAWLPDYKIVTGDDEVVIEKLREAISKIMQDGIQVSLIE